MSKPEETKTETFIEVISGAEGECLSLNDFRIAGPKTYGGRVTKRFETRVEDVLASIATSNLPKEYTFWHNGYYKVKIEKIDVNEKEGER